MKMIRIWKSGCSQKSRIRERFESSSFSNVVQTDDFREKGLLSKRHPFGEELSILGENR